MKKNKIEIILKESTTNQEIQEIFRKKEKVMKIWALELVKRPFLIQIRKKVLYGQLIIFKVGR